MHSSSNVCIGRNCASGCSRSLVCNCGGVACSSIISHINKLSLHQVQLVLGWVTNSVGLPSVVRHSEYVPMGNDALWLGL